MLLISEMAGRLIQRGGPKDTKMIRNINGNFGDVVEFATVAEMAASIAACGYELPADGLREGRDFETVAPARFFYAGHSFMGVNFTYDSPCWKAYRFTRKKERDEWVEEHKYDNGNMVAEKITRKEALKIIGYKTSKYYTVGEIIDMDDGSIAFMPC